MMTTYAKVLKSDVYSAPEDTEILALVLKYNKSHGDDGRFTSHDKATSRSGSHDTTRSSSYGVTGSRHKALVSPKTSSSGKRDSGIHREANTAAAVDDAKHRAGSVSRDVHDALYTSKKPDGSKVSQAAKLSTKKIAGRDKTNRLDYGNLEHVSHETARHLLTAVKTKKSVTIFQSKALDKNADQKHRQITQHIDAKAFKNLDAVHDHLDKHGLGDAIVHKTDSGYSVQHSMQNSKHSEGTKAGKVKQRKVMEFRRSINKDHITTEHHAGERKTFSTQKQHEALGKFAAANPDHHIAKAYLALKANA